jgi:Zn finger protein HypA/HybF involved in hydrogenase expression
MNTVVSTSAGNASTILILTFGAIVSVVFILAARRAFSTFEKLMFHCRRCDRDFTRNAWHQFPRKCSLCRARDWNT